MTRTLIVSQGIMVYICTCRRRNVGLGSVECIVNAIDIGDASEPLDSQRAVSSIIQPMFRLPCLDLR